jgi:hypothetical protein
MYAKVAHHSAQREGGPQRERTSYGWQANLRRQSLLHKICAVLDGGSQHVLPRSQRPAFGSLDIHAVAHRYRRCTSLVTATAPQRIVYILKNGDYPPRFYSGVTAGYSVQNFAP